MYVCAHSHRDDSNTQQQGHAGQERDREWHPSAHAHTHTLPPRFMSMSGSSSQRLIGRCSTSGPPRFRTFLHNTICDVMLSRGWKETDSETEWDFFWADVHWMRECFDHIHFDEGQRINHFRNHFEMTRKDLLNKNLKRIRKQLQREDKREEAEKYAFSPTTYNVPSEYTLFVEEFKRHPKSVWIMKPIGKAQGKGIFLFNKLNQISEWKRDYRWRTEGQQAENYVVQRYVENPYLVGGKKFDLRLYLLVTSYSPLTAYLYRGGFARFSFHRFSMEEGDIDNTYIHLTNVAIQKGGEKYDREKGCKWNIRNLKLYMVSKHGLEVVNQLFEDIKDMMIRTLLSVQKIMINDKHCFELYGYDILIDQDFKPWLLEVNASPSLSAETKDDYDRKFSMLEDVINIIELEKKNGGPEQEQVGGFDLIVKQGHNVHPDKNSLVTTSLGCLSAKEKQLRRFVRRRKR